MSESASSICAVCGQPVSDGSELCAGCASEVTMRTKMTVCPNCRTVLPAGGVVCENCNTPIHSAPAAPAVANETTETKAPKPRKRTAKTGDAPKIPRPSVKPTVQRPLDTAPAQAARSDSVPTIPRRTDSVPPVPRPKEAAPAPMPVPSTTASSQSAPVNASPQHTGPVTTTELPSTAAYIRETEQGMLEECCRTAVENRKAASVFVTGEAGMGVTLLLKTLPKKLQAQMPTAKIIFLVARQYDDPFFPFSKILRDTFSCDDQTDANAIRVSVSKLIGGLLADEPAQIVAETAHLIGYMAGVPFANSPILASLQKDQEMMHTRLKAALLRYFRANLKIGPLFILVDDAHRLNLETRGGRLFKDINQELRNVPFVSICGGRQELLEMMDSSDAVTIRLEPLGDAMMRRLFFGLLPKLKNPPPHLVEGTVQRAAGNPGALYELCSLLKESGAINTEGDEWVAVENRQRITEVLSDRRDALRARIDQIDPRDKLVLQTASVFGDVFWDDAITAMSRLTIRLKEDVFAAQIWADDSDTMTISASIERLVERRFLVRLDDKDIPDATKYAFSRSSIREKILITVGEEMRNQYHCLAAEWLYHMSGKSAFSLAELEAAHWQAAGQKRRAALACFRAAEHARIGYMNQKAVDLYKRGLELTGPEDRLARIDVLHDLGSIYELQGRLNEAEWCLTEMLRNAWILGYRNKGGAALNKIGRLYRLRGDGTAARAFLNRAMTLFKTVGDERGVAACLGDLGELARQEGSYDRAYNLVRESFEIHRKLKNRRSMAVCLQSLGNIDAARAQYDRAERFFTETLEMRRKTNDRAGMAQTLSSLASLLFDRGELDNAVQRFEAALEITMEVGDRRMEAQAHCSLGEVYREKRDFKASMAHFKTAEEIAKSQKDRMLLCEAYRNLAALATKTGDVEAARKYVERALEIARKIGAKEMEALAFRALGELESTTMWDTSKTEGVDEASEAYKKALQIFRGIGNELQTARTLHALGNRLLERGAIAESRTILKEAKEIFNNIDSRVAESIDRTIRETSDHSQSSIIPSPPKAEIAR